MERGERTERRTVETAVNGYGARWTDGYGWSTVTMTDDDGMKTGRSGWRRAAIVVVAGANGAAR